MGWFNNFLSNTVGDEKSTPKRPSQQQQSTPPNQAQPMNDHKPRMSISKYGIILDETEKHEAATKPILKKESTVASQGRRSNIDDDNNVLAQSVMNIANLLQSQMNMSSLGRQSLMGMPLPCNFPSQLSQFDMNSMNQQQLLPLQFLLGQQPQFPQQITKENKSFDNLLATMGMGGNTSDTQDEEDVSQGGRVYKGTRRGGKLKVADKPRVATYLREERES
ncbi:unnamed protein product [Dimorphilus gyrociliatus]|uniref:Uncharacterized protein n=1 Tax=Dimorphilus gyrociliatus TaxID=2664684 RepID=A0A7I8VTD5_9ANNE|nr:unnamed protein product [Dimorphilus gyrociliatus]